MNHKKSLIILLACLFAITRESLGNDTAKGNCQKGWEKFGSKCYKIFSNQRDDVSEMTFEKAKEFCENQNVKSGSLVSIHSQDEQDFLTSYLGRPGIKSTVWIGLQRPTRYSSHQWLDGSKIDYKNWVPGEPNNDRGNERCAQMQSHEVTAGQWNDIPCDVLKDFICEAEQEASLPQLPKIEECIICPNNTVKYRESCYATHAQKLNWYEAEQTCHDDNGHLVSVSDNFEMAFLRQLTKGKFGEFWIGLQANIVHQRLSEHKDRHHLTWSDFRPVHHLTWAVGQPKYSKEEDIQCVEMNKDRLWEVSDCINEKPFVCIKHPNAFAKPARAEGYCPSGLSVSSRLIDVGHENCYYMEYDSYETVSWSSAQERCEEQGGGRLAIFKNLDELKALTPYLSPYANKFFWVGIKMINNKFKTTDGEDFDQNLWQKGEPNELYSEKCAAIYAQTMKLWNSPCFSSRNFICEVPKKLDIDYEVFKESKLEGSGTGGSDTLWGFDDEDYSSEVGSGTEDNAEEATTQTDVSNNVIEEEGNGRESATDGKDDATEEGSESSAQTDNNAATLLHVLNNGIEDEGIDASAPEISPQNDFTFDETEHNELVKLENNKVDDKYKYEIV